MRHFETAFHRSDLFDYNDVDQWVLDGSKSVEQVAHEKMKALLTSYKAPALDLEIEAALKEYISNRKAEINS